MNKLLFSGLALLGVGILILASYGIYQLAGSDLPLIIKIALALIVIGFGLALIYVMCDRLRAIKEEGI
ncbi:MAG: hypothetical protein U9Q37_10115 [Euryarchaeota archaeon]|uniref:Uncharacterized protein n=1 Tax=Candidatus Methanogaster sp. TaxID=3386292 RepID=A0AC61KZZ8_9EURY|nr:hypothetical protein [Euryarchaeota archaeon]PXF58536.1 MAG: hypothetical protein C4B59_13145 [ANME-2 cluster archaeon]